MDRPALQLECPSARPPIRRRAKFGAARRAQVGGLGWPPAAVALAAPPRTRPAVGRAPSVPPAGGGEARRGWNPGASLGPGRMRAGPRAGPVRRTRGEGSSGTSMASPPVAASHPGGGAGGAGRPAGLSPVGGRAPGRARAVSRRDVYASGGPARAAACGRVHGPGRAGPGRPMVAAAVGPVGVHLVEAAAEPPSPSQRVKHAPAALGTHHAVLLGRPSG
jgi:hypothetical protein